MSDTQTLLVNLSQGVHGTSRSADDARRRRAQMRIDRAEEPADVAAVTRLLVEHRGEPRETVKDPAFLAALREDIGTNSRAARENVDGRSGEAASEYDPLVADDEAFDRTLESLNAAEDHVGHQRTTAYGLRLLAGIEDSQHLTYARQAIEREARAEGIEADTSHIRQASDVPAFGEVTLRLRAHNDLVFVTSSDRGKGYEVVSTDGLGREAISEEEAAERLGMAPNVLDDLGADMAHTLRAAGSKLRVEATNEAAVAETDWTLPRDVEQVVAALEAGVPSRASQVAEADPSQPAHPRGRVLEVSLSGADDAEPRYVGIDVDGSSRPLSDRQEERAAWMGLSSLAEHELEADLLSAAEDEAVWAAPGDRVSASSAHLSEEQWKSLIATPTRTPVSVPLPGYAERVKATNVRVDLGPLRERAQASQARAATSLDALGVGHSPYGINTRPDHPQPGAPGTQQRA